MRWDVAIAQSRVGQGVFTLVTTLVLTPVILTAAFAYWGVREQALVSAQAALDQSARDIGQNFLGGLLTVNTAVQAIESLVGTGDARTVAELALQPMASRVVWIPADSASSPQLPEAVWRTMDPASGSIGPGKDLPRLVAVPRGDEGASLYLVRHVTAADRKPGYLVAEIEPRYIWQHLDAMSFGWGYCVAYLSGAVLHCSGTEVPDQPVGSPGPGQESAVQPPLEALSALPLRQYFMAEDVTVRATRSRAEVLAGMADFKRLLLPLFGIAALLIVWASAILIRRRMRPLDRLTGAAARIASGDFSAAVDIGSDDEFQQLGTAFNEMRNRIGQQFKALQALSSIDRMILTSGTLAPIAEYAVNKLHHLTAAGTVWAIVIDRDAAGAANIFTCHDGRIETGRWACGPGLAEFIATTSTHGASIPLGHDFVPALVRHTEESAECYVVPILNGDVVIGLLGLSPQAGSPILASYQQSMRDFADRIAVAAASLAREERLFTLGYYDELTGLPNRQLFKDRLQQAICRATDSGRSGFLLFVDLDHFKQVNDTEGHTAGDDLLTAAGERIVAAVRPGDTVARLGGDEFTVIIENAEDISALNAVCQRIEAELRRPFTPQTLEHFVSASIGVASFPQDGSTVEELLRNADLAMYQAKVAGRDRTALFRREMALVAHERVSCEARLRQAIARNEMALYYQPQIAIDSGAVVGAEALLRWIYSDGTVVPPAAFIGIAEDTGIIRELGRWAIERACRDFVAWRRNGMSLSSMSVNLSLRQLRDPDFEQVLAEILAATGMPRGALELEVTESMMADDPQAVLAILHRIVATGVRVGIDDFGTGYSSLSYLRRMPVQTLKIDKRFMDDVPESHSGCEVVRSIVMLAQRLDLLTVAEGIESARQLRFLEEIRCPVGQGYIFATPLTAAAFVAFVSERAALRLSGAA